MRQLSGRIALEAIGPFIIHEYHVVESQALMGHVQEPHGHGARPHHQSDELYVVNSDKSGGEYGNTYKVYLKEESPISQPVGTRIARLTQHKI
jgi:hypothetical protein